LFFDRLSSVISAQVLSFSICGSRRSRSCSRVFDIAKKKIVKKKCLPCRLDSAIDLGSTVDIGDFNRNCLRRHLINISRDQRLPADWVMLRRNLSGAIERSNPAPNLLRCPPPLPRQHVNTTVNLERCSYDHQASQPPIPLSSVEVFPGADLPSRSRILMFESV